MLRRSTLFQAPKKAKKLTSAALIAMEDKYSAHNYHPAPVVFAKAKGVHVWDPEGRQYIDFMSGYGAVNQGHLHPKIVRAAKEQLQRVTLSCRAFHNDQYPIFAKKITELFGYDRVLPMNTGAEAVETAVKIAKKWAHRVKNVATDDVKVIAMSGNFHGRTHLCISMSDDPDSFAGYEPLLPGIIRVPYGDEHALQQALDQHGTNTAAIIAEPIQGEAGVVIPPEGYLRRIRELATQHNVLYISDEIQAGLGRTGYLMATEHEGVKPDIAIFAKALGGGLVPISCALANNNIMEVITPGTHGSTFGGNPLAAHIANAALDVLVDEKLSDKARSNGPIMAEGLTAVKDQFPQAIADVRSRGLWGAIQFTNPAVAADTMAISRRRGLLIKTTHETTLRLAPPLVITPKQLREANTILLASVKEAVAKH